MATSYLLSEPIKCRICGKPYKIIDFYGGDQSACYECITGKMIWRVK